MAVLSAKAPLVSVPTGWRAEEAPGRLAAAITARTEGGEPAAVLARSAGPSVTRLEVAIAGARSLTLEIGCSPEDRFAGLGERFIRIPQRGRTVTGWNFDGAGELTYFNAPVLHCSGGWTLVVDTALRYHVDVAATRPDQVRFEVPGDRLTAYLIEARIDTALRLLTEMTGRPPEPPGWVFGVWHNVRSGTEAVLEQARRLREERIPGSVLWIDEHYDPVLNHGDGHPGNYPTGEYPDLGALVDGVHALGFKALTYLTPHVFTGTPCFEDARRGGLLVKDAAGEVQTIPFWNPTTVRDAIVHMDPGAAAILDLTLPEAETWFRANLKRILLEQGWDGWMQDFGEQVPPDAVLAGGSGEDLHNRFVLLYHAASRAEQQESKPDSIFFARSGYLGAQALAPCIWGGDQTCTWDPVHGLPSVLPGGLSAGLLGVSTWGPDISGIAMAGPGFKVAESTGDRELWIRWAQLGAWSPLMRTHLGFKPLPKRNLDLWRDATTQRVFRALAETHIRLYPYLRSLAAHAARTGIPIMRAPLLEFPDEPTCWEISDQFMLGPALMVAPVMERGARRRRVYLPEGTWFRLHSAEPLAGPAWIEVEAGLEEVPVFQRAGTAVPVLPRAVQTLADPALLEGRFDLDVWVATGGDSDFEMFDGTRIRLQGNTLSAAGGERRYCVVAHGWPSGRATGTDVDLDLRSVAGAVASGARRDWRMFWDGVARARSAEESAGGPRHAWRLEPDPPSAGRAAGILVEHGASLLSAEIVYRVGDQSDVQTAPMRRRRGNRWTGDIPGQPEGAHVGYRIRVQDAEGERFLEDAGAPVEAPHSELSYLRPASPDFSYITHDPVVPDWCRDSVLYHVLVDRFARSDGSRVCQDAELRSLDFHGGNLKGLSHRLDHVQALGADCLWVSPIYPGEMHVTYDVKDLFGVDSHFGTVEDVRALLDSVHGRGMRALLDFEVTYLGSRHPFALDARRNAASKYRDWFLWHRWPDYHSFFGLGNFILLNHANPDVRRHLIEAARFWLDLGFDGFRLDSATACPFDFWTEFGAAVREAKPDAVTLAESISPPEFLRHYRGRLTGFLDFGASGALRNALTGRGGAPELAASVLANRAAYPPDMWRPLFFENHDMDRLSLVTGADPRRARLAALLALTVGESPVLYYGTEVGLAQTRGGELDIHNRLCMPWEGEQDGDLLAAYRELVALRKARVELRRGGFEVLEARAGGLFAFARDHLGRRTVVAANLGSRRFEGRVDDRRVCLPPYGFDLA